jgi:hypothetical protein
VLPFGLRNATVTINYHIAQCICPPPTDSEFVRMVDYLMESIHDLLALDSELISNSS